MFEATKGTVTDQLKAGDPIEFVDLIDQETVIHGTVLFVEPFYDRRLIYVVLDNVEKNIYTDPRFPNTAYGAIIPTED